MSETVTGAGEAVVFNSAGEFIEDFTAATARRNEIVRAAYKETNEFTTKQLTDDDNPAVARLNNTIESLTTGGPHAAEFNTNYASVLSAMQPFVAHIFGDTLEETAQRRSFTIEEGAVVKRTLYELLSYYDLSDKTRTPNTDRPKHIVEPEHLISDVLDNYVGWDWP